MFTKYEFISPLAKKRHRRLGIIIVIIVGVAAWRVRTAYVAGTDHWYLSALLCCILALIAIAVCVVLRSAIRSFDRRFGIMFYDPYEKEDYYY